jgi:hypothetical protein
MIHYDYRCGNKKCCANLISTPGEIIQVTPELVNRWLATESPNNFRLLRTDFLASDQHESGGFIQIDTTTDYTGNVGNSISVYDATTGTMKTGTVTALSSPPTTITTDITWVPGTVIEYLNDNTLRAGYYFEGQLTINNVLQSLTIKAHPDSFGYADLDVSGILRIMILLGKVGDYSTSIMKESGKSGKFTFKYREVWYESAESYTDEGNTWYYCEAVRSEEEGSSLAEFAPDEINTSKPFFNSFAQPVYFVGLPFDLSFINSDLPTTSPAMDITVTIKQCNAAGGEVASNTEIIAYGTLEGYLNSYRVNPNMIVASATHLTIQIN